MGLLEDTINDAFDMSRQRATQTGSLAKTTALSGASRSAKSQGLKGVMASELANRTGRLTDNRTQDRLRDLSIARNTALGSAKQWDTNRADRIEKEKYDRDLQKKIANEQMWGNIWGGIGGLAGNILGGKSLLKSLIPNQNASVTTDYSIPMTSTDY